MCFIRFPINSPIQIMTLLYKTVENSSLDDGIRKYLGLNLKMLSFIGMEFNLNNDRPIKKSRFMQTLPIFMTNVMTITVAVLEVIFLAFVLREHLEEHLSTQICSELLSNVLCISKSLRMATTVESMQAVLDEVSVLWATYRPDRHCKMEIIEKARKMNFSRCYLGIIISGLAAFALPPIHNFVYHYFIREVRNYTLAYSKRIFVLRYPFEINNMPLFCLILIEEGYLLIMSAMYWVTCDTLFAQLTTHTSIQLKILHYDIRALINHEIIGDRLKSNIVIIIKRHQGLLRYIEDIFSPVIFATVLLSALSICMNIFEAKATSAEGNYTRTATYSIMAVVLFFQILFYCSFAETLKNQTRAIAESVYNCKWTEKNYKLRFYLQMIMMKSQSPFYCTAYGFFPIGHARMASIMNTSFSYLMMLQSIS